MHRELKGIRKPGDTDTVWRYISFEKFADLLATGSLFFTRADKYDDKFEGYIPKSIIVRYKSTGADINPSAFRPYIMCSCWHHGDEESMAMWDKYHLRNSGVAIRTTMGNLWNSFLRKKPNVFIGQIEYIEDPDKIDIPIDVKDVMDVQNFLPYFYFYKRTPFKHEQEVRAIIDLESIPRDDPYKFGTSLKINVKKLMGENSEVIVSPHADEWIASTLELIVKRCGFQFPVNRSTLLDPPERR